MDYCSSCRRHLNGALVCPGCGAYAPDIAPVTAGGHTAPGHAGTVPAGAAESTTAAWELASPGFDGPEPAGPSDDSAVAAPAPEGRAARRRRLARLKKTQRRALVATAVALVGGGLTVAAMDRHSADPATAAPAPEATPTGGGEEPTTQYTAESSARAGDPRSGTPRPSHTPAAQSPSTGLPHRQYVPDRSQAAPSTAQPDTASRSAAGSSGGSGTSRSTATSPSGSRTDSPVSGGSGTGSGHTATSSQPTSGTGGTGGTGSTGSGGSQATPTPPATSPSNICVLGLVCLG